MKPIERLARDICWAEFATPPKGTNKREYWNGVHAEKKAEYIEDAKWLTWIVGRLPEHVIRHASGRLNLFAEFTAKQRFREALQ